MSIGISRRRWLVSAAATACLSPAMAQQPDAPQSGAVADGTESTLAVASNSLPISSRTTRLHAIDEKNDARIVVTAIAAEPNGELLAVAGNDHVIRVMNASSLAVVKTLESHRDVIRTLAFDATGKRLVSAGNDGQLILWDCQDGFRIVQRMQGAPALSCVRFSANGSEMAAVGFENDVYIIGRRDRQKPSFRCECNDLRAVAYRDDDRVLAVAGRSGNLHLFDPQSGGLLSEHPLHQGRIHGIVFQRNSNSAICVSEDGTVTVFDTENRKLAKRITVGTAKLYTIAVLDSQRVAVAGSDNTIRIINTDTGQVEKSLTGHEGTVASLAASGGTLFSGGYDATLRLWPIGEFTKSQQRIAEVDPRIDR